ncbi:MAG: hypothetical protein JW807_14965 [Spirochaetes bacterium]|nr:hypothetical protein [Spirochaetota bacterium]
MRKTAFIILFAAGFVFFGCDTFKFSEKSRCLECLTEAKSRANLIATTLLQSKNPTVKVAGGVLTIATKDQTLKVSCGGGDGCIVETRRIKADGSLSEPHAASRKEVDYLFCPRILKKYNPETE